MSKYNQSRLSVIFNKIVMAFIDVFCHPICINACLHYSYGRLMHRNWGDDINIYILEKLWNRKLSYLYYSTLSMRSQKDNYLAIGSTLGMLTNEHTIVWGSGTIDDSSVLDCHPKKILAVRGPLTRQWLLKQGVDCPEIYGDPALLLPRLYTPSVQKKRYKLGIIPHYDDFNHPVLSRLKSDSNVLFIKMEGYDDWTSVIDQIASCDYIASSSLHGLIVAEAYGIPNLWLEISGKLLGGHFKFHDFFLSLGKDRKSPFLLHSDMTVDDILNTKNDYQKGFIDLQPLIQASPFLIKL